MTRDHCFFASDQPKYQFPGAASEWFMHVASGFQGLQDLKAELQGLGYKGLNACWVYFPIDLPTDTEATIPSRGLLDTCYYYLKHRVSGPRYH